MTAVTGKQYGVGARRAIIYALNASGSPAATNTTAYSGVQVIGARAIDLTISEPRKFSHVGDDNVLAVQYLPPIEGASGTLTTATEDQAVYALLTSTSQITVGESTLVGLATSEQGTEDAFGLLVYQQSQDNAGTSNYRYFLMPKTKLYPRPSGMGQDVNEHSFTISPSVVTAHLWETAFAAGTEGFTSAQGLIGQARYRPSVVSWLAATTTTTFTIPSAQPGADTAKYAVWVDGVADTAWTKATTQIVTATAPGNNKRVVLFYEW